VGEDMEGESVPYRAYFDDSFVVALMYFLGSPCCTILYKLIAE